MSNRPSRSKQSAIVQKAANADSSRGTLWIFVVIGLLVLGALAIAVAFTAGDSADFEYGTVQVSGSSLAPLVDAGEDPAIGQPAPEVTGAEFDGTPVEVTADGRPKVLIFLAHWCGHCQAEVPVVQDWIDENGLPADVDLVSISTRFQPGVEQWPADRWLEDEGWSPPVLVDDEATSAANAFGLSGTPYYVAIDADGNVVERRSGEIGIAGLEQLIASAAGDGSEGTG